GIQFLDELMPSLGVPFGCNRLFEIGVIREKVPAQGVRDSFAARFVEQLGVRLVSKPISGCSGDCSSVEVVVGQLEPVFLLLKDQRAIMVQGFVEALHIQLFNRRWGWMTREAAERANFWHNAQEKRLQAGAEAGFFVGVAPFFTVPRI